MLSFSEPRGEYTVNVTPKCIDDVMVELSRLLKVKEHHATISF